jgi:hypothetical protein
MTKRIQSLSFVFTAVFIMLTGKAWAFNANNDTIRLMGTIMDINREYIDSVTLNISDEEGTQTILVRNGKIDYVIPGNSSSLEISIEKAGYRSFETTLSINENKEVPVLNIRLFPGYKILLKGRVRVGNIPIEDVNVLIKHKSKVYNQQTLGCYLDSENFWNCLFLGMFKVDISADNPNDSITLFFTKQGYKPHSAKIKFGEYDGSVLDIRLEYADVVPDMPMNNVNLKVAPPSSIFYPATEYTGWLISGSYFRTISEKFNRLALGVEATMLSSQYEISADFLDSTTSSDSTFIDIAAGPSVLFWVVKPDVRKFSTYIGGSLQYSFSTSKTNFQPFIGTRYFLDLRKSLSLEVRYINHQIEKTKYDPQVLTSAVKQTFTTKEEKWVINLGIQITF